jgi:predicted Zn-dependent protease
LLLTKYSRDAEREADRLGVRYAALRGYDASEGAAFFESLSRIGAKEGLRLPSWQSTHPDPGEREESVVRMAQEFAQPGGIRTVNQEAFLARLQGMIIGDNPREGFVESGRFVHPEMRFQFPVPSGWNVRNERAAVLLMDPNRGALMALELVLANSAREAAEKFSRIQGVTVSRSGPVSLGGLNAYAVQGTAQTPDGAVALLDTFIELQGRVFSLLGYTSAQRFANYAAVFQRTAEGFSPLTDPQLVNIQPARLTVQQARQSGPFRSFLPARLPPGMTAEDLAILNQVQLNETIPAGTPLKLPGQPGYAGSGTGSERSRKS